MLVDMFVGHSSSLFPWSRAGMSLFLNFIFPQHSCPVIKVMNATATVLTFACKPRYAACLC